MHNWGEVVFALILIIFFAVILWLFQATCIYFAWNGFLSPVFHIPFITKIQAFFAALFISIVFQQIKFKSK